MKSVIVHHCTNIFTCELCNNKESTGVSLSCKDILAAVSDCIASIHVVSVSVSFRVPFGIESIYEHGEVQKKDEEELE